MIINVNGIGCSDLCSIYKMRMSVLSADIDPR